MRTYVCNLGEDIQDTAEVMVYLARRFGDTYVTRFNEVELIVEPTDTAAEIVKRYQSADLFSNNSGASGRGVDEPPGEE